MPDTNQPAPSTLISSLLILVLTIACFLRLVFLGEIPDGFYFDESAVGVNASLIAQGGIDQYGNSYPVFFRALDDYKNSLYIYFLAVLLKVFELNEFTTRLPAAIFGVCGILVTYYLAVEIFKSRMAGVAAALLVAVSPIHFHYSRIAWQAITLTVFYPLALIFVFRFIRNFSIKPGFWAACFLAISLYTYTVAKLLVFVTVFGILVYAWTRKANPRSILFFMLVLGVISLPYVTAYLIYMEEINLRFAHIKGNFSSFIPAYFSHFSIGFLFEHGPTNVRHGSGVGILHWYMLPLLLLGFLSAWLRPSREILALILVCMFVPVLGSLTAKFPNTTRVLVWVPFLQILAVAGLLLLLEKINSRIFIAGFLVVVAISSSFVFHDYFTRYARDSRPEWSHGFIPALQQASRLKREGELVISRGLYIDWMFANRVSPNVIIENAEAININKKVYDYADKSGKYDFLGVIHGSRKNSVKGMWVIPISVYDQLELFSTTPNQVLYKNSGYIVTRIE